MIFGQCRCEFLSDRLTESPGYEPDDRMSVGDSTTEEGKAMWVPETRHVNKRQRLGVGPRVAHVSTLLKDEGVDTSATRGSWNGMA